MAALFSGAVSARPSCDDTGAVEDVRFVQAGKSFRPVSFREGQGRPVGAELRGTVNSSAQFGDSTPGLPIAASFQKPEGHNAFAVWWRPSAPPTVTDGSLVSLSSAGETTLLRFVTGGDEHAQTATDQIYSPQGSLRAERDVPYDPEAASHPTLSVRGDVVYERPKPGATVQSVQLLDPMSFQPIATVSLEGEHITDVLVVDRKTTFFTARGGVFVSDGKDIRSIGPTDLPMRHESLDFDPRGQRVMSHGPGGYTVFNVQGVRLGGRTFNSPLNVVKGFTHDGLVWHSAAGATPMRVLDAESGAVVAEYEGGDHTRGTTQQVACVFSDRLVLADARGESRVVPLKAKH